MRRFLTTLVLFGFLGFAGCGGGDSAPTATDPSPESSAATAEPIGGDVSSDAAAAAASEDAPAASDSPAPAPAATAEASPVPSPPPATTEPPAAAAAAPAVSGDVDLSHISAEGALAIVVRPAQAMNNPVVMGVLQEMEKADPDFNLAEKLEEMREETGIDVNDVDHVLVTFDQQHFAMLPMLMMGGMSGEAEFETVTEELEAVPPEAFDDGNCDDDAFAADEFDAPPGDFGPGAMEITPPTVLVKFARPVDGEKLVSAGGQTSETREHGGQTYYFKGDDNSALWFHDETHAIIASEEKVKGLIDGETSQPGPLADMLAPIADKELALVLDVRPLHGLIGQLAQENPVAAMAGGLAKQVNTLTLAADLQGESLLELDLHTINEGSAGGLQGMLGGFLQQGQTAFAQQMQAEADSIPEPLKQVQPLLEQVVNGTTITAEAAVCRIRVPRPEGLEKLPAVIGPAIGKARDAAKNAEALNNLKMIAIAFHNHHDVYRSFPALDGPGVDDAPGAGLSWRVHLLPFIEEAPLYEAFNLDEPWDSDHNRELITAMPDIFGSDPAGKTSIHVFTGEGAPFQEGTGVRMRDIRDGTSNTILMVEAGPSTAQVWTKPGGLELNADDPIAALGDIGDEFPVSFMDGFVRKLPADIDPKTLKLLIQHNDGTPVQIP